MSAHIAQIQSERMLLPLLGRFVQPSQQQTLTILGENFAKSFSMPNSQWQRGPVFHPVGVSIVIPRHIRHLSVCARAHYGKIRINIPSHVSVESSYIDAYIKVTSMNTSCTDYKYKRDAYKRERTTQTCIYSRTSQSGQSKKRTHSLQRTKVQSWIEKPIHIIIHWQPPRSDHL